MSYSPGGLKSVLNGVKSICVDLKTQVFLLQKHQFLEKCCRGSQYNSLIHPFYYRDPPPPSPLFRPPQHLTCPPSKFFNFKPPQLFFFQKKQFSKKIFWGSQINLSHPPFLLPNPPPPSTLFRPQQHLPGLPTTFSNIRPHQLVFDPTRTPMTLY